MKKFLILILICSAQNIFCQTKGDPKVPQIDASAKNNMQRADEDDKIYNVAGIDTRPEFPGGIDALNTFIKQNFKTPKPGLKGKIYITFIIEKDGSLNNINVLRDLGYETGAEAIRVLQLAPKWSPGKQNNKIIRVLYSMPMIID
ncbi:energy transducer TonB [Flavobacterium sp. LHD-80]|uniref:energy transducer TonB n=1 Tax=Flavobacterium sp. LHD-80 TaxID=3071411 RepID=UPI0027E11C64|nr:energy transducer TonB [Flavobacterium sp. LHD-80]MDQ6471105.1 energy transducer TonB [Flavobacterium sp. LHD-80]